MHSITNGFKRFLQTNLPYQRKHVPLAENPMPFLNFHNVRLGTVLLTVFQKLINLMLNNMSDNVMYYLNSVSVAMLVVSLTELAAACEDDESLTTWNMSRNSLQAIHLTVHVVSYKFDKTAELTPCNFYIIF